MKSVTRTASVLDKFLHIVSIAIRIASVSLIIGLGILAAGFLFDLPPHVIGTGYNHADLGFVTFTVAENYLPDHRIIWCEVAMEIILALICMIPAHLSVKAIRNILAPMKNGEPFHNTVSTNLKKLANYSFALGIGLNLQKIISNIFLVKAYDLHLLLLSEKISHVDFMFVFDLSFLVIFGVLLLLSYIFRYGEELQQLSDETL
ncbi:MAG: hypothetical protein IJE81_04805 [Oscillospiraceae bacterium]|nr:hypothetical protein [Oscillospiraceae bacterium]MBQ7130318.1 hypothetical protein [Oscillospiraceae bacterium]